MIFIQKIKELKYLYDFEKKRFYKYILENVKNEINYFICNDEKCEGKGEYNIISK